MCGRFGGIPHVCWFLPKECNVNPFNGDPATCGHFDQKSVDVLAVIFCSPMAVLIPINIPEETPLMLVIRTVPIDNCVTVLVVILMCGGFD